VNDESFSIPVAWGNPIDPIVAVTVPPSWGWPAGTFNLNIPADVTGASGTDASLVVVNDGTAWNFWGFQRSDLNHASAAAYAIASMTGSGFGWPFPVFGAGIRASGASALGGLIASRDILASSFDHALAVSLNAGELSGGFVAPAIAAESGSGSIPVGARLGIPAGTPMPDGLSPLGQKLFTALVQYGAIVVDRHDGAAPVAFYADPRSVSVDTVDPLRSYWMPGGDDLDRIMPFVRVAL
jgi:hypothetical protein